MSKNRVPASVRAQQRWKGGRRESTLDDEQQREIFEALSLYQHVLTVSPGKKDPWIDQDKVTETRRYADVGLKIYEMGHIELAAYCAFKMVLASDNRENPLLKADIKRNRFRKKQSDNAEEAAKAKRKKRDKEMDAAARAYCQLDGSVKSPTIRDVADHSGLTESRIRHFTLRKIAAHGAQLNLKDELRKPT